MRPPCWHCGRERDYHGSCFYCHAPEVERWCCAYVSQGGERCLATANGRYCHKHVSPDTREKRRRLKAMADLLAIAAWFDNGGAAAFSEWANNRNVPPDLHNP